jgi:DNA-binding NarL/FixJ family response regulator
VDKVVLYTWNVHEELVTAAVERGAAGYLSKALPAAELVEALERIRAGDAVLPAPGAETTSVGEDPRVVPEVGGDWPGRAEGLTAREAEVVALITQGLTNEEIAARTHLSINSVKSYIRSAYRRMGVTSRSRAVLWGLRHGFEPDTVRVRYPDTR